MEMTYEQRQKLLKEADKYIQEGNTEDAKKIFDKVFKNDTLHIYAVILTESNPEYSVFSKEFNTFLNEYYQQLTLNYGLRN